MTESEKYDLATLKDAVDEGVAFLHVEDLPMHASLLQAVLKKALEMEQARDAANVKINELIDSCRVATGYCYGYTDFAALVKEFIPDVEEASDKNNSDKLRKLLLEKINQHVTEGGSLRKENYALQARVEELERVLSKVPNCICCEERENEDSKVRRGELYCIDVRKLAESALRVEGREPVICEVCGKEIGGGAICEECEAKARVEGEGKEGE